jgi:hypothetical protein
MQTLPEMKRVSGKADQMDLGSDDGLLEITDINISKKYY